MMEINGIAHIQLTVNDLQRAIPFYEDVLGFMGMKAVAKAPNGLYMVGGRTAVAITRASEANRKYEFDQRRIGLHHICFRARSKEEIDSLHAFLVQHRVRIVHPPEDGSWAPGYYSMLFEDPEGIRLEVNFVPGRGAFRAFRAVAPKDHAGIRKLSGLTNGADAVKLLRLSDTSSCREFPARHA